MLDVPSWALWLSAGAFLIVAEIFTGTFFLVCFGIAALVSAGAAASGLSVSVQWLACALASGVLVLYARPIFDRGDEEPPRKAGVDRNLGETGVVLETIDPAAGSGRIKVLHDEWRAQSIDGEVIEETARVIVEEVRGTHLLVRKIDS